jgi:hypothetical protein
MQTIGNINAKHLCNVYRNGKHVAYCADTINAIAYAFNKTGGDSAKSPFENFDRNRIGEDRIQKAGYFTNDKDADFVNLEV